MLKDTYKTIKPTIVAIVQRVSSDPVFPEIIGTGFIVNAEYGLIMTNDHVLKAMHSLPRVKGSDDWPASVLILKETKYGLLTLYTDIKATMSFKLDELRMYTSDQPDMAILRVALKDLPEATIKVDSYAEGQGIATAGFPMGTMLLKDGKTMNQIGPTLKSGIVSAILPFPCTDPTALMININSQGGQSGSPIFDPEDGEVIGLLYAGAEEPRRITGATQDGAQSLFYRVPTDITYAVPSQYLKAALDRALNAPELKTHLKGEIGSYDKYFEQAMSKLKKGETPTINSQIVDPSQVEPPTH